MRAMELDRPARARGIAERGRPAHAIERERGRPARGPRPHDEQARHRLGARLRGERPVPRAQVLGVDHPAAARARVQPQRARRPHRPHRAPARRGHLRRDARGGAPARDRGRAAPRRLAEPARAPARVRHRPRRDDRGGGHGPFVRHDELPAPGRLHRGHLRDDQGRVLGPRCSRCAGSAASARGSASPRRPSSCRPPRNRSRATGSWTPATWTISPGWSPRGPTAPPRRPPRPRRHAAPIPHPRASRAINGLRHALLARLGAEPSEWDLLGPDGGLDRSGVAVRPIAVYLEDLRSPFNVGLDLPDGRGVRRGAGDPLAPHAAAHAPPGRADRPRRRRGRALGGPRAGRPRRVRGSLRPRAGRPRHRVLPLPRLGHGAGRLRGAGPEPRGAAPGRRPLSDG